MTEVLLLGGLALGLAVYALHLQKRIRTLQFMAFMAADTVGDIADGKAEAIRTSEGILIRKKLATKGEEA